jgi:hypothetical protein
MWIFLSKVAIAIVLSGVGIACLNNPMESHYQTCPYGHTFFENELGWYSDPEIFKSEHFYILDTECFLFLLHQRCKYKKHTIGQSPHKGFWLHTTSTSISSVTPLADATRYHCIKTLIDNLWHTSNICNLTDFSTVRRWHWDWVWVLGLSSISDISWRQPMVWQRR